MASCSRAPQQVSIPNLHLTRYNGDPATYPWDNNGHWNSYRDCPRRAFSSTPINFNVQTWDNLGAFEWEHDFLFEEFPPCRGTKIKSHGRDWCRSVPWLVRKCIVQCLSSWQVILFQSLIGPQATRGDSLRRTAISYSSKASMYLTTRNYVYPCWCHPTVQDHRLKRGYSQPNVIKCCDCQPYHRCKGGWPLHAVNFL